MDIDSKDLWGSYKNGVLKACDELCGKTKARDAENKNKYRNARNETKKVIAKTMRQEAEEEMNMLCTKPNDVFKFVKFMRKEGRDIDGGGCMKDKNGRLVVSEKDRGKLWKEHMEKIMNVENEWDQMVEVDMVEEPVEGVTDEEVMKAMNKMKLGKAGPSEVNMDIIIASGTFGVGVMKKLCQRVFDGKGMPEEWKTSVVVPIFKGKGGVIRLWSIQRSRAAGACNEDSGESAGEQN